MTRVSYTTWAIDGPKGRVIVRRIAYRYYIVGRPNRLLIPGFFCRRFYLKSLAIELAEEMAGLFQRANQQSPHMAAEYQQPTL